MSSDLINDSDAVPGPPLPGLSADRLARIRRWSTALVIAAIVIAAAWYSLNIYAEYLWYDQLGYGPVYLYLTLIKTALFLIGGLLAATLVMLNISMALPLVFQQAQDERFLRLPIDFLRLALALLRLLIYTALLITGLVFGSLADNHWELVVLLLHQAPFGVTDPQFGRDVSFYVVNLQVLRAVQAWFLALLITIAGISAAFYAGIYLLRFNGRESFDKLRMSGGLDSRTLRHLALLGILIMFTLAIHHVLSIYELTLSEGGVVVGATYTDVHARIPAYWFLAGIALLGAAGFGVSLGRAPTMGLRLMAGAFTLWLLMYLLAGVLYPALFQRFRVSPDEFAREETYIRRNIEATRAAYGLEGVEKIVYPVKESLTEERLGGGQGAMENIRLWDEAPLLAAYNQLQFMELYYNFVDTDSDRYVVDGRVQQVLIGARELDRERLPEEAGNWVNRRLQYTHGYGVAMTAANGYTMGEGRPEYLIRDIPIKSGLGPDFSIERPEIYYGESASGYAIVGSGMGEVNPVGENWRYEGEGGVALNSWWRRALYAVKFGEVNIGLSDQVGGESRIQFRREVGERVKAVAPFLKLDVDPYPVVDGEGKLWWIQDAYTVTERYPYATGSEGGYNYIRNSVKAVVDAYDGGVNLYVMEAEEAVLGMWRGAFPGMFEPFSEMPEDLQRHIRYPATLFEAQAERWRRYHVTDPQVFFNQAEQWDIPLETRFGKTGIRVTPTYLLMRLPGEEDAEFVLLIPFSPAGEKKNLVGWLAARNDPPHYGQLRAYYLPDDRQVDGPSQVEARIENDQDFSQQFTLWDGSGSEVIRGRLLAIPIADTIVYVEPLYLQSTGLNFPELKKVILADNTNLVMADSMAEAVARLVGGEYGAIPTQPAGPEAAGSDQLEQLDEVEATVEELEKALEDLERSLQNLRNTLGGNSP